jgi:hypothetical protein
LYVHLATILRRIERRERRRESREKRRGRRRKRGEREGGERKRTGKVTLAIMAFVDVRQRQNHTI